ncbi:MAG: GAF domain-containing protein, partial [Chloroflexi bacterium]|nr:GAF domain-containing protein [Chloroflexota bacterium]
KPHQVNAGTRSVLVVPVRAEGSVIGVITVTSSELGHFTPDRVRLLSGVADSLGPLLENTRLQEAQRLRARELGILLETTRALASTGTFNERAGRLAEGLAWVTGAAVIALRIPDHEARVLRLVAAAGPLAHTSDARREIPRSGRE